MTYAVLAETYLLIFWSKKINFFDGGYRLKGGAGWTLMHELVLARMEPRMGPSQEFLLGQEEVDGIDNKKTSLRGFCQMCKHRAVRQSFLCLIVYGLETSLS